MSETDLVRAFGAFFAIMNPFVNLPIFLALTAGFTVPEQRALAMRVVLYSGVMCLAVLVAGSQIIAFFGVTVDEFRVAGGIVLGHIAFSMLNGQPVASHAGSSEEKSDLAEQKTELSGLAFYPITFPMVVGPGTIATIIIYSGHTGGATDLVALAAVIFAVLAILFAVLFFASAFGRVLTTTMRTIASRLMGMILLAIAVSMITAGLKMIVPGLA